MSDISPVDQVRQESWNRALLAYGTGYIFSRRAAAARKRLRLLTFLGIAVPLAVGGVVTSFGTKSRFLPYVLVAAGVLGLVQLIMSAWALVAKWDDALAYSLESTTDNNRLANSFEEIAKTAPPDLATRYAVLKAEDDARRNADLRQGLTEPESRMGMRAALRQFQRPCAGCKTVPVAMTPTECDVCGKF